MLQTTPGSVIERKGRFTALAYTRDPATKKVTRPSLGTFATKEEAEYALVAAFYGRISFAPISREIASPSDPTGQKVEEYLREWLARRERNGRLERRSLSDLRDTLNRYAVPAFGHLRLDELTTDMVADWVHSMVTRSPRPLSPRTARKALDALHRALRDARLPVNPAKLDPDFRPRDRPNLSDGVVDECYPTLAEVDQFLVHIGQCEDRYGARQIGLWTLAAQTGMRRAELAGASWADFEASTATLRVRRSLQVDHGVMFIKAPKSRRGNRLIGLYEPTTRALDRQRETQAEEHENAYRWQERPFDLDLMFRDEYGGALNPDLITQAFTREWRHAGLRSGPTLHGLRHSHASALLEFGVSPNDVADRLGDDLAVLLSTYRHTLDRLAAAKRASVVGSELYK